MANEDWDEAVRRVQEAWEAESRRLSLGDLMIDRLPETLGSLASLEVLHLQRTEVSDLSVVGNLVGLLELSLLGTRVADISIVQRLPNLMTLSISDTSISDLSPLIGHPSLQNTFVDGSNVSDLRPLLSVLESRATGIDGPHLEISFHGTPACRDPGIAAANEETSLHRPHALLAHLRTLPPWPEPLEPLDRPREGLDPVAPSQDPTIPLIWGKQGFQFLAAQVEADPITEAALEELRELVDTLIRKGNEHDDLYRRACKARDLLGASPVDALRLHLQYQALRRLRTGAETRTHPFDDETLAALDDLADIVPGITLTNADVLVLIERQEQDRTASRHGIDPAREELVLEAVAQPDAPFEEEVRFIAEAVVDKALQDRLTGLRPTLSRNSVIAAVSLFTVSSAAGGIIGNQAHAAYLQGVESGQVQMAIRWVVANGRALTSLMASISPDAYWWSVRVIERLKAEIDARTE